MPMQSTEHDIRSASDMSDPRPGASHLSHGKDTDSAALYDVGD